MPDASLSGATDEPRISSLRQTARGCGRGEHQVPARQDRHRREDHCRKGLLQRGAGDQHRKRPRLRDQDGSSSLDAAATLTPDAEPERRVDPSPPS